MLAMNHPQTTTMQQQAGAGPPFPPQQQHPQQQQPLAPPMGSATPGIFAANSFGSASSPPTSNVNLQLQQAAPLTSSSFHIPSPRQGGEKRGRSGGRLSISSTHSAPPLMPVAPPPQPQLQSTDDDDNSAPNSSSSKKRRSAEYIAPRTVPTTFTSVTAPGPGLRRNLSFSRIDPYVSYAQTPSLMVQNNATTSSGDGMDMDASTGNQSNADSRVRSMSF